MNAHDEALYPKLIDLDVRISELFARQEQVIAQKAFLGERDFQVEAITVYTANKRLTHELQALRKDAVKTPLGAVAQTLLEACRARVIALTNRALELLFKIDEEHLHGDEPVPDEQGDIVTVLTIRGNNRFQGKFVRNDGKGLVLMMEGRERFIPADNIEYIEKVK